MLFLFYIQSMTTLYARARHYILYKIKACVFYKCIKLLFADCIDPIQFFLILFTFCLVLKNNADNNIFLIYISKHFIEKACIEKFLYCVTIKMEGLHNNKALSCTVHIRTANRRITNKNIDNFNLPVSSSDTTENKYPLP